METRPRKILTAQIAKGYQTRDLWNIFCAMKLANCSESKLGAVEAQGSKLKILFFFVFPKIAKMGEKVELVKDILR